MVDVLGWLPPEGPSDRLVKRCVREVILPADHVRDREVGVVDNRGEVIGRRAVCADQRRPALFAEPKRALLLVGCAALEEPRRSVAVPLAALTLAKRALVPPDPEPLEIGEDLCLGIRLGPPRIGVVDAQDENTAVLVREPPVRDGRERAAEVQRAGRTGCESDASHDAHRPRILAARDHGRLGR